MTMIAGCEEEESLDISNSNELKPVISIKKTSDSNKLYLFASRDPVDLSKNEALLAYKKKLLEALDNRLSLKWYGSKYWSIPKQTNTIRLKCKIGNCPTKLTVEVSNNGSGTLTFTDRCSLHRN